MTSQVHERERHVALALLVRRHLIRYEKQIKAAYAALATEPLATEPLASEPPASKPSASKPLASKPLASKPLKVAGSTKRSKPKPKPKQHGTRTSTALAKLIGLPLYKSSAKAKPEAAKYLFEFLKSAGPEYFDVIFQYFKNNVITPDYRAEAPPYIRMAIYEVFDAPLSGSLTSQSAAGIAANSILEGPLWQKQEHARHAPHAVIASIEETVPQLAAKAKLFEGTWNVVRFSHHGKRVVRLAMEVKWHEGSRATFRLYYRTRGMTVSRSKDKYVVIGSLIVLRGGQHIMFLGHEEAREGQPEPDGYPITIICPTRIARDGPFIGIVQRRHDDGKVFAIKAQFVRDASKIDELFADNRVGSFESEREISTMGNDIRGFYGLLAELERSKDDVRSGLVL